MPKPRYHHGDLRRALMAEMTALVDEQGVQAATLRDAARRAGVSEAAPYHHFRGKTDLLGAIAFEGYGELLGAMRASAASCDDPLERLGAAARAYVRFALENRGRFRVMFGEQMIVVAASAPDEVRAVGRAAATFPLELGRAVAAAFGHPERDRAVYRVMWSLVHGAATLLLEREIRFDEDEPGVEVFLDEVATGVVAAARAVAAG